MSETSKNRNGNGNGGSGTTKPRDSPRSNTSSFAQNAASPASSPSSSAPTASLSSLHALASIVGPEAALALARSSLVDRARFSALTGYGFDSFDGIRDLFIALGFKQSLTIEDYRNRFRRGGIAKRLIECLPDEMWDDGVFIQEEESDPANPSPLEIESLRLFERLGVISRLTKADKLASLGRYSAILIGVKNTTDLSQPLQKLSGAGDIIYLLQFAEDNAKVISLISTQDDPRFLLPEFYEIKSVDAVENSSLLSISNIPQKPFKVHWSRIIHVAHGLLESDWIGTPALQASYNDLETLYKITWGGGEAAWRRMDPGIHYDLNPEYSTEEDDLKKLDAQIEEYRHNLRRDLKTEGVKVTPLNTQVDKFDSNAQSIIKLIAGTHGIPYTLLLGEELGLRASEQNRENLDILSGSRRKTFGDSLVRQFIDRMISCNALPASRTGKYKLIWGTEAQLSDLQKAELAEKLAHANALHFQATGESLYTTNETRDKLGDGPKIEEDQERDDIGKQDIGNERGENEMEEEGAAQDQEIVP